MTQLRFCLPLVLAGLLQAGAGFAAITLDGTFGTGGVTEAATSGGVDKAREVAEQPADGKVVLVGVSPQVTGPDTFNYVALARFSSSGALDAGFGTGGKLTFLPGPTPQNGGGGDGRAVLIQPADQKILVAGNWDPNDGSGAQIFLARFDSAGVADPGFGTAGIVLLTLPGLSHTTAEALVLQTDDSIVVAGSTGPTGSRQGIIARVSSTGTLDPAFATGGVFSLGNPSLPGTDFGFTDIQAGPGDSLVASGGGGDLVLVKLSSDGVADTGFDADGIAAFNVRSYTTETGTEPSFDVAAAIAVLPDGRILVTGSTAATATGPNTDAVLARITSDGALDTSYGSGGYAPLADASIGDSAGAIGVRTPGDAVIAGVGFFPMQVSPAGRVQNVLSGAFQTGTEDLDVLSGGSVLGGGFLFQSAEVAALAAYRLNATDLADGTDTVPDPVTFTPEFAVQPGSTVTSNAVTITGIAAPAAISVSAGDRYAIGCTSGFVTTPGTISNGQTVCVRTTAAASDNTAKDAVLTVGTVRGVFTSVTGDSTPDQFTFVDQTDVVVSTLAVSAPIPLTGLDTGTGVSVTGGEYSVGCTGTFTSAAGNALPGDQICVRHTASSYPGAVTSTTLRVGAGAGTSDTFTSTTAGTLDTSPDAFSFVDQTDVEPSTVITSAAVTITGINNPTTVLVTGGGSYSIGCSATYTASAGTVLDGQTVCVRHTSAVVGLTPTSTTLTVGDAEDTFTSTTRDADTTPNAFNFVDRTDVDPSTPIASAPVTINGINALTPIAITGGSYSVGCTATYTATAGTISNGQTVCVRHTSSATGGGVVSTTLTVGGVSDTFTSTTRILDSLPNPFSFVDQTGVPLATVITSAVVVLSGYDVNVPVSISGGSYSVECSASFTTSMGTVPPGARICVRHTSGTLGGVVTSTVLTVGGVSDTFSSTTIAGDASPTPPFSFVDQTGVDLSTSITSAPVTIQGTDIAAPISVTGGEYSIDCTGVFTAAAGSVAPGKTVCVRHQSSFDSSAETNTTLIIGDISDVFTSTTRVGDQTPDDFSFVAQTDVSLSTIIVSSPITLSGVDSPVQLFLSGPFNDVGFARDCVEPYSANLQGEIFANGDRLCVLLYSPATDLTSVTATLSLGGSTPESQKSATFTVTTGETVPDAFAFTDQVGVLLNATVHAEPITITGITAPGRVVVSNGQWQLNCTGGYTSDPGFVANGETICVRHIAAGSLSTLTSTVLTVGGISDTFTSTTVVDKPLPGSSAMDPWSLLLLSPLLGYWRRRAGAPSGATC